MGERVRFLGKSMVAVIFALLITAVPRSVSGNSDAQSGGTEEGQGLFTLVQTVQVTPDDKALAGGFIRLGYVPALDQIVAVYSTHKLAQPEGGCMDAAHVYKVYTTDMQPTGQSGVVHCEGGGDSAELFVDNVLYDVSMYPVNGKDGWLIQKFDAVTWKALGRLEYGLDSPREGSNDMMIELVNGMLDVSSMVAPPGQDLSQTSTHHNFFTPDLQFLNERVLADTPNTNGASMIFVDGTYYFITGTGIPGNVIVMQYDTDWKYLGIKVLRENGTWPEGVAFDGQRFYVAYMDTTENIGRPYVPLYSNIHLAAFDRDWNFIEELAVTHYTAADDVEAWRPWILLHGSRMYVSYDVVPHDPTTHKDIPDMMQAYVAVYELNTAFSPSSTQQPVTTPTPTQTEQPTGQASACSEDELSPMGVLRSTDHGATWESLGNACLHGSTHLLSADPTPLVVNGSIVLYFLDLKTLTNDPTITTPRIIYRATSTDGVNFDQVQPAYTQASNIVDPFVLAMPDGSFRMYFASDPEGIISAASSDGLTFTREEGVRSTGGGMPGAMLLPDGRVRLFLAGNGIASWISSDGLNFTLEDGVRISTPPDSITDDPEPIHLADGSYLMLYQISKKGASGLPWEHTEIHLATSTDGFTWTTNPAIIGYGGTSCVVEAADGTLYLYYGH